MERRDGYRSAGGASWQNEVDAFYELAARVRTLRVRTLMPTLVIAILAGFAGAIAHATGYWSLLGVTDDGSYFVCAPTIIAAAAIPAAPIAGAGWALYRWLLVRTRAAWFDASIRTYGLTRDVLEERARIFD